MTKRMESAISTRMECIEKLKKLVNGGAVEDINIFSVIELAIMVAAADGPDELRRRRDRIVQTLEYACSATTSTTTPKPKPEPSIAEYKEVILTSGCFDDPIRPMPKPSLNMNRNININRNRNINAEKEGNDVIRQTASGCCDHTSTPEPEPEPEHKEVMLTSGCFDDPITPMPKPSMNRNINTEEERNGDQTREPEQKAHDAAVLMMKEARLIQQINANVGAKSEVEMEQRLYESLKRLESMQAVSVESLKSTQIGMHVSDLRKHHSARIRSISRSLVSAWIDLADEWAETATPHAKAQVAAPLVRYTPSPLPAINNNNNSVHDQRQDIDHVLKMSGAKRKLEQAYQQVQNAKKQRSIQLIDFHPYRDTRAPSKLRVNIRM